MPYRYLLPPLALLLTAATQVGTAQTIAPTIALTIADVRSGLVGHWQGKLEYRDYQADRWFGLPVAVTVELGGDRLTLIRKAAFDDGRKTGTVHITTVALFDPKTAREQSASFRAGRPVEVDTALLRLERVRDATHWMLIEQRDGRDDERPARIRETTTRDGDGLVTLKEVDFADDAKTQWLVRNRTTLARG